METKMESAMYVTTAGQCLILISAVQVQRVPPLPLPLTLPAAELVLM